MHRPNIEEHEKSAGLILIFYDIIGPVRFLHWSRLQDTVMFLQLVPYNVLDLKFMN